MFSVWRVSGLMDRKESVDALVSSFTWCFQILEAVGLLHSPLVGSIRNRFFDEGEYFTGRVKLPPMGTPLLQRDFGRSISGDTTPAVPYLGTR